MRRALARIVMMSWGLVAWSAHAQGQLIAGDDPRFGQHALTIDTANGSAWLNLSFSTGYSYDRALAATEPGGRFDGFQIATADPVISLFNGAGVPFPGQGSGFVSQSSPSFQAVRSVISLVGSTGSYLGEPNTLGISATGVQVVGANFGWLGSFGYFLSGGGGPGTTGFGETYGDPSVGVWLVREVPEPGVALLVTLGGWLLGVLRGHGRRL